MATNKRITPGREGYKILFNENTVIMNHKFAAAAAKYGTKENKLMKSMVTTMFLRGMLREAAPSLSAWIE